MMHKIAIFLVIVLQSLIACCQTSDSVIAQLQNNIKGHKFVLCRFGADAILPVGVDEPDDASD